MWPEDPLPPLNVPAATALQLIADLIAQGQAIVVKYSQGSQGPRMALDYSMHVSNWTMGAESRINSLFVKPIMFSGALRTMSGSIDIAKLKELFSALSLPPALPEKPVSPSGFTVVAESRIAELINLKPGAFDFAKLIRLCEELNTAYSSGCFLASIMITRAILDHVPPVFGMKDFPNLVAQYPCPRSFKEAMQNLEQSARKIADLHLHGQIRKQESLPTPQQVNFSHGLDLLLSEIIRVSQ